MATPETLPPPFASGGLISEFRKSRLPIEAFLAGYSAVMRAFDLRVPLHHEMAAVAPRHMRLKEDGWRIFPLSRRPADDPVNHLIFPLKWAREKEFKALTEGEVEAFEAIFAELSA